MLVVVAASGLGCGNGSAPPEPTASVSVSAPAPIEPAPSASASAAPAMPPVDEPIDDAIAPTLDEQREKLFVHMKRALALTDAQIAKVREIFGESTLIGQGNPFVTQHPMTQATCRQRRKAAGLEPHYDKRCGAPYMVPVYDREAGETADDAPICIDQFEFPNIPCEYPVVYARASEVVKLCEAIGKRVCDAGEWEGACAGSLRTPEVDYFFGKPRPYATWLHNTPRELVWAYGKKDNLKCATGALKSPKCDAGGWTLCGSNTYPAGSYPECVSPFGVYDQHGNAAEHMNLATDPRELASRGGLGQTEMKGSWFVFQQKEVHEDDCRWRAKDWHPSWINDPESHRNYHLGFRCCKDVD